jgi:hypothetical protein
MTANSHLLMRQPVAQRGLHMLSRVWSCCHTYAEAKWLLWVLHFFWLLLAGQLAKPGAVCCPGDESNMGKK